MPIHKPLSHKEIHVVELPQWSVKAITPKQNSTQTITYIVNSTMRMRFIGMRKRFKSMRKRFKRLHVCLKSAWLGLDNF